MISYREDLELTGLRITRNPKLHGWNICMPWGVMLFVGDEYLADINLTVEQFANQKLQTMVPQ